MIHSLLDNDLYKFTMMAAVWSRYRSARVCYRFINRNPRDRFPNGFASRIQAQVDALADLTLTGEELTWLRKLELFNDDFLTFLSSYRLRPGDVHIRESANGSLEIKVSGLWHETILWEVVLMAIICETYYERADTSWDRNMDTYFQRTLVKGIRLSQAECSFVDFGTRRRRSYSAHDTVIRAFCSISKKTESTFLGTSNVHLARHYDIRPIGTMAHEWIMGHAGMFGIPGANRGALEVWREIFGTKLLLALTDTYRHDLFFKEFAGPLARAYDGIRQDSGDPYRFIDSAVAFYRKEGIDPSTKSIVFSDGLSTSDAIAIRRYAAKQVRPHFGIGTHFTNDFPGSPALNIVIKLFAINGRSVAKVSDTATKTSGSDEMVAAAIEAIEKALEG